MKLQDRDKKKEAYLHYDEKLAEMNFERNKKISKRKEITEDDHERFIRNIGKYQKAAKEYVTISNVAYRSMNQFLDYRYELVASTIVGFVEAEKTYYNEAAHIFNFFNNTRNNAYALRKTLIPSKTDYEASNYIRGKNLLNISLDEVFRQQMNYTGYSNSYRPAQGGYGGYGYGGPGSPGQGGVGGSGYPAPNPFGGNSGGGYGRSKTMANYGTYNNYAQNNPYNTQVNPYSNNMGNTGNYGTVNSSSNNPYGGNSTFQANSNNAFGPSNTFNASKLNGSNPYGGNNSNPYGGNNSNPYGGNNNNPYGGNNNTSGGNDINPYGGTSNPYGGDSNPYGGNDNGNNNAGGGDNNDINQFGGNDNNFDFGQNEGKENNLDSNDPFNENLDFGENNNNNNNNNNNFGGGDLGGDANNMNNNNNDPNTLDLPGPVESQVPKQEDDPFDISPDSGNIGKSAKK